MKIAQPKPFTFEGGEKAVLLLHGFTGNSADVRMLGRFLEKKGYTCHAPHYKGHGVAPEELVHTGPKDWWKDVMDGYEFLKSKGHESIAAVGLSLGGVFSLKLGYTVPIKGIVPMCAPMYIKSEEVMYEGVLAYAREYKKREGKSSEQIEQEMEEFKQTPMNTLKSLQELIAEVRNSVDMIYAPTFVVQGRHDHMINTDSANIIYNSVESPTKDIKWYEESGHTITFDKERDQLHEDVYAFLESLDW
ncbi:MULTISPECIES: alpha/beta hydrolase [Priestia]|jgi:carboxylesterase|uniref:Carboxylesterase n=10 Tax=Bacillaceae TaxID=186817 RepID=D5DVF1_PRIM1|nr:MULTISPECIES: carboxylesterase [Priestia]ACZ26467.1 esterase [Bacillus sp. NK13]AVX10883.1 carboxylesterase [Bacillus sp. Y-01]KOP76945.1 carboxylesterase [Bacillus sp. FJAT-21351]KQU18256.1 carboxylesterase [Bacillus sp. Leaf75]KRD82854.1 carboxylesterase [Bacillus sp. Root147]KRD95297.1 carboxylesterase [Bacillus sp. Root239]KRF47584.1 carboxylesterase [Bacillus sp. Soil531]MBZ5481926.1 carboxylesterase [Bacillus sp. T_4]MCF6798895.1 carboxylesterase [Bacillus sp. ET1]MDH6651962.1 ca